MTKTATGHGFVPRAEVAAKLDVDPQLFENVRKKFPIRWPRYYLDLVDLDDPRDPIARMGKPHEAELLRNQGDLIDPVADRKLRPVPFVVRKHRNRIIILTTKKCHFYCRFCFRREEPPERATEPQAPDWQAIAQYLREHPEIEEPILSGGDPLTLKDKDLFAIRDLLLNVNSVTKWRIHTRAPVHFPQRVTPELVRGLVTDKPLRVMIHANHPNEFTAETRRIAALFQAHGIALFNQAVLLKGVNDHVATQVQLWNACLDLNIQPYYLHHTDPVPGNVDFRVSMTRGLEIVEQASQQVPNFPRYVIDLPDGTGKVAVAEVHAALCAT